MVNALAGEAPTTVALEHLLHLLAWEAPPQAWRPWQAAYDVFLWQRVQYLCEQSVDDGCIFQALQALSPARCQRFLRTPQVARLLYRHDDNEDVWRGGTRLAGFLLEELGDLDTAACDSAVLPCARRVTLLADALALDLDGRQTFPDEDGQWRTVCHASPEREAVLDQLSDAMAALQHLSPSLAALVTTCIEVLALRCEPETPRGLFSSTFSHYVGLVRITNAHLAEADAPALMDALVHEAIHCLLYRYEESCAPFQSARAWTVTIQSPWTGATIALPSYLQACMVWYGLFHLWRLAAVSGFGPAPRVAQLAERARVGFCHRPVSEGLIAHRGWIAPAYLDLLLAAEARMLAEPPG
ncbi:aKG-HExxH-type peptide beta-hydroxylase [Paludibacterium purpuratum]|uniref:HEXXH motif-containing protein n=1 Tax=Paludibacterium purpuratum TaxID=1144873 RepID=A0A4R7BCK2_9NEIS|nr:HEXXH motif-containing putative peptide modification protein [Paludibacterium purpuratum]TDR82681.1 hypothetical protein DFP86_10170 [Paludibacterium purpuratum]